jgi:hypothetical protein
MKELHDLMIVILVKRCFGEYISGFLQRLNMHRCGSPKFPLIGSRFQAMRKTITPEC